MGILSMALGLGGFDIGALNPISSAAAAGIGGSWTKDPEWLKLGAEERAAAMALMEADTKNGKIDIGSAKNALGAMINRADKEGKDLGEHVSGKIYQPTIESSQHARLPKIIGSPEHQELVALAKSRRAGETGDWVNGATHFLAPEKTMLALEAREPSKYKNWGPRGANWTGYDPETGEYRGVVMRDGSHAFLAPEGAHSAQFGTGQGGQPVQVAQAAPAAIHQTGYGREAPAAAAPSAPVQVAEAQKPALNFGSLIPGASLTSPEGGIPPSLKAMLQNAQATSGGGGGQQQQSSEESPTVAAPQMKLDLSRLAQLLARRGTLGTA